MSAIMERLRAADPLPDGCAPPPASALRALLDSTEREQTMRLRGAPSARRHPHRASRRRLLVASLAALAATVAVVALLAHSGGRLSLVARAYAATEPAGGVLHYSWTSRLVPAGGASARSVVYRDAVWRSATRSRTVGVAIVLERHGPDEVTHTERVTELTPHGERFIYYDGRTGQISRGTEPVHPRRAPTLVCTALPVCAFGQEDPVKALRRLYPSLHQSGAAERAELSGAGTPVGIEVYLDPRTGDPLRVVTRFAPGQPTPMSTTVFSDYERLPLDAATEAQLRFATARHKHPS